MQDTTLRLLAAAIFALAAAYFLTNLHKGVVTQNEFKYAPIYVYNTVTGVVKICEYQACRKPPLK
jgi:hypothetical protein